MAAKAALGAPASQEDSKTEGYATLSQGLFPRFIIAGVVSSAVEFAISFLPQLMLGPMTSQTMDSSAAFAAYSRYSQELYLVSAVVSTVVLFSFFYLVSRVRLNLHRDHLALAASIFAGGFLGGILPSLYVYGQSPDVALDLLFLPLVISYSIDLGLAATFLGFTAALVSYRRRN